MPIPVGALLGAYEITALIGKGGMGEVYRAWDRNLQRDVAIKTLPAELSREEARILASLTQGNIAVVHDFETIGETTFLVLEFVEGESLSDILKRGPLPIDEVLKIGQQICSALESAHAKGIIHRELKPANIKITPEGQVKVLDFGLAKVPTRAIDLSEAETVPDLTGTGEVVGTVPYMSPEQLRGKSVDRRSDIWSFGCVLWECLTGASPFTAENPSDCVSRILRDEPDAKALSAAPPEVVRLILRCLRKDPDLRLRDAGDIRIALDDVDTVAVAPSMRRPRRTYLIFLILAGLILTEAALILTRFDVSQPAGVVTRTSLLSPDPQGAITGLAASSDGRMIAIESAGAIWLKRMNESKATKVKGSDGGNQAFWSPDSGWIGFAAQGKLWRINIAGGPADIITDAPAPRGASWLGDQSILFVPRAGRGVFKVPASGGAAVEIVKPFDARTELLWPVGLPDNDHFLFAAQTGDAATTGLYLGSAKTGSHTRVSKDASRSAWVNPGFIFFNRGSAIMVQRLDLKSQQMSGEPRHIIDDVAHFSNVGAGLFTVSGDGPLVYRNGADLANDVVTGADNSPHATVIFNWQALLR